MWTKKQLSIESQMFNCHVFRGQGLPQDQGQLRVVLGVEAGVVQEVAVQGVLERAQLNPHHATNQQKLCVPLHQQGCLQG